MGNLKKKWILMEIKKIGFSWKIKKKNWNFMDN